MSEYVVMFVSDSRIYRAGNGKVTELGSEYMENYKNTVMDIRKRNAWKTTGQGAMFMGMGRKLGEMPDEVDAGRITALTPLCRDKIVYAFNVGSTGGLYTKNPFDESEQEGYIIRKKDLMIFEMDYDPGSGNIIASVSEDRVTRNLAMFHERTTQDDILTEGDVLDRSPSFSRRDPAIVYYDSAGFSFDENGGMNGVSARSVLKLNLNTGDIDTVAEESDCDCYKPAETADGTLYYLKRPTRQPEDSRTTVIDMIHMPGKVFRAVFGWLNFFTQRYSGESLKKNGAGPVRAKEKTEEQIFIEGNLVNVTKSLRENMAAGDCYPGVVPKTWQLIRISPDGSQDVAVKGLIDYTLDEEGAIIYSNGKHIVRKAPDGRETLICEANLADGLQVI